MNDDERVPEDVGRDEAENRSEERREPALPDDRARSFEQVRAAEVEAIRKGRSLREGREQREKREGRDEQGGEDDLRLSGLTFSGGGIRSATFNLGIAQGLARLGLLRRFDYLSINSGGGYIGGWLLAWIRRAGLTEVERELAREGCRDDEPAAPEPGVDGGDGGDGGVDGAEPEPISFLRRFSNYLTPQVGAFSADTWTMAVTYLRNLLLNLVILVLALAAALIVPRVLVLASSWSYFADHPLAPLGFAVVALAVAITLIACNQREVLVPSDRGTAPWYARQGGIQVGVVLPLFVAAWFSGLWMWFSKAAKDLFLHEWLSERWAWYRESALHREQLEPVAWALLAAVLYLLVWIVGVILLTLLVRRRKSEGAIPVVGVVSQGRLLRAVLLAAPLAGAVGGFLVWAIASLSLVLEGLLTPFGYEGPWHLLHVTVWKAPAITAVFVLTAYVHTGLMGRAFPEALRQWWSRLGAWLLIWAVSWLGVFGIALYGPILLVLLGGAVSALVGGGWITSTIGGVVVGRETADGEVKPPLWRRAVIAIAPQIFIVGMLASIALGAHALLDPPTGYLSQDCREFWVDDATVVAQPASRDTTNGAAETVGTTEEGFAARTEETVSVDERRVRKIVRCHTERLYLGITRSFGDGAGNPFAMPLAFLLFAVSALVLSWRVDINEFSMHLFYRNRLIRAYLGASNRKRNAQPFTGFDPTDDLPVSALEPDAEGVDRPYDGPFPIYNIALNLVAGEELAWQERKAASFVVTPLYSGYQVNRDALSEGDLQPVGFRPTRGYQQIPEHGISLGTAMTISGAAASPSMGAATTPAMAFLLTVFNVRLGWWLGNPRHDRSWSRMGPVIGLHALLSELFGATDDRSRYVYLSDGGHFENLALYELIRRRCRFIVVSDAGADPDMTFEDLGNAVRKACTDFGVEIDLDPRQIERCPESGLSEWHCAVGKIRYDRIDGGPPGTLVYVKASLTGDEPIDAQAYATAHSEFPHEPTSDQWFSESQFESYRKLGEHVALSVFGAVDDRPADLSGEELAVRLSQTWFPPSSAGDGAFTRLTGALDLLMERLRTDPKLRFLVPQIYPEWPQLAESLDDVPPRHMWLPETHDELVAGFFFCHALIQLMEDCYLDLELERELDHPDNRGWLNLFKHWSWAGMLRATWAVTASTFGARFQVFCRRRLGLEVGDVAIERQDLPGKTKALGELIDRLGGENRLNFLERKLVRGIVDGVPKIDRLLVLRLVVRDPEVDGAGGEGEEGAAKVAFTFGMALARGDELVYLRVQDHLRKMGLARRALRRMVREKRVQSAAAVPREALPAWCRETPGEDAVDRLRELFRSARQQEEV